MPIPINFSILAQWAGILTLVCLILSVVSFIFGWGIRFRLVGVTGFMGVLAFGLFALGVGLFSRTKIPGAIRYSSVYDNGAAQVVIAVPPQVSESELEATLRQAADDLFSYGRLAQGSDQLMIRARTITHPEAGISNPLYLGQVKRSLATREDENMQVEVFPEGFAQLGEL